MNNEELERDINERNFQQPNDKCKLIHSYENSKQNYRCAIIEVSLETYQTIKYNGSFVYIEHQISCLIYAGKNLTKKCND